MVDLINANVGGGAAHAVFNSLSSKSADVALPAAASQVSIPQPAQQAQAVASIPNDIATQDLLQKRTSALKEAITAALPLFFYPVSNVRFTIYKEAGQFVTNVTNIVTGEKTKISEPQILSSSDIGDGSNFVRTIA